MAYILTPRFAPAYQAPQCSPFGICTPRSQPTYGYRTIQRPQCQPQSRPSPFASFFSQLDDLINEIDHESQRRAEVEAQREAQRAAQIEAQREAYQAHIEAQRAAYRQRQAQIEAHIEAQREAHRQRQRRKFAPRPIFSVTESDQGWQVDAEVSGFEQENINIEVTDENTLRIAGNTKWGAGPPIEAQPEHTTPAAEHSTEDTDEQTAEDKMKGIKLEPAVEIAATATETTETGSESESVRPATPDSDTASHRSYQATVEDDFEDLGPEASVLFSTSSTPTTPSEPKGKEKAVNSLVEHHEIVEDPEVSLPSEASVIQQPQPEAPAQQQQEERPHGSFERTLRFPGRIDASNVRATLREGTLSISVPRMQVQQLRRIAIL